MDEDLEYFLSLSQKVNESLITDLHEELSTQKAKTKDRKKWEAPGKNDGRQKKESRVETVTLGAAPPSSGDEYDDGDSDEYGSDIASIGESDDAGDGGGYKFSSIQVPVHPDLSTKKGKSKYQKLREAKKQEQINAADPKAAAMQRVKILAAGGKVGPSVAQVEKSIKKEKQQKRKKFEKKKEKEAKEKKREEIEAKKASRKFDKSAKKFENKNKKAAAKKPNKPAKQNTRPSFKKGSKKK